MPVILKLDNSDVALIQAGDDRTVRELVQDLLARETAVNHADRRYPDGTPYDNDPAAPDCSDLDRCRWPDDPDHAEQCATFALARDLERGDGE